MKNTVCVISNASRGFDVFLGSFQGDYEKDVSPLFSISTSFSSPLHGDYEKDVPRLFRNPHVRKAKMGRLVVQKGTSFW